MFLLRASFSVGYTTTMEDFPEKRGKKGWLYSIPVLIVLIILVLGFGRSSIAMYKGAKDAKEREGVATGRLEDLMERKNFLESSIGRLSSAEGIEQALREKFNVRRPGEDMIILVSPEIEEPVYDSSLGVIKNWFNQIF